MSFLEKLLLGLAGAEVIDEVERRHDQRLQEREQRRQDELLWQDAARRDSDGFEEDEEDW